MNEVAVKLRKGDLDKETVALARDVLAGMSGFGRAFSAKDKENVRKAAEDQDAEDQDSTPHRPLPEDDQKGSTGRIRRALMDNDRVGKGHVKSEGEMKEDDLGRLIESGKSKVVPEYRKPLEDYYKAVSE